MFLIESPRNHRPPLQRLSRIQTSDLLLLLYPVDQNSHSKFPNRSRSNQKFYFRVLNHFKPAMSQFNFINDMNSLLNLDGDLKMQSKPRWQRKQDASINSSKLSVSYNTSMLGGTGANTTATGSKTPNKSVLETKRKTPNDKKSPGECFGCLKLHGGKVKEFEKIQ
jgi:hypothetical protein